MSEPRIHFPELIKREVRQRCGFGCVICGLPLYTYEHMEGYAAVKRHVASEITLLCDKHQREKTAGLLPLAEVRAADRDPINKRLGVSHPYDLHYAGSSYELVMGGNLFVGPQLPDGVRLIPVAIDRTPLLSFTCDQGHLFLSLEVHDAGGNPILLVDKNELLYATSPWDIQFVGRNLAIREKARKFLIDLAFDPPHRVEVRKGRFSLNGLELLIRPEVVCYANTGATLAGGIYFYNAADIVVGELPEGVRGAAHVFPAVNRGQAHKGIMAAWMRECASSLNEPPEAM